MSGAGAMQDRITDTFETIQRTSMAGVPILNHALSVEVVGLQDWEGRAFGIVVTPWLMSFLVMPGDGDDWGAQPLGAKQTLSFPAGAFDFLVNDFPGLGPCLTRAIQSPMKCFPRQDDARAAARRHLGRGRTRGYG
ncbi:MAG: [NiFe]-hydrogenase assembly chaperone HybE [Alphaproteobacteria bacterium]|nr:[NiFe]-hydrogenase assembly chaperone HybE [Alphaproteobacteria bacterium]